MNARRNSYTDETLLTIGQMIKDGYRQTAIAQKLGVGKAAVSRVATGRFVRYNNLVSPPPKAKPALTPKQKIEARLLEIIDLLGELK